MTENRGGEADQGDGDDGRVRAECGNDEVHRLPARYEGGGGISHVHESDQGDDEAGALRAELAAALNHLRHTEARTLSRMQRHEDRADQVAEQYGNHRGEKGLVEDRGAESSGYDGQHVQIRPEPEREQLVGLAVPLVERDLVDRVLLDARGFLRAGLHRGAHRGAPTLT